MDVKEEGVERVDVGKRERKKRWVAGRSLVLVDSGCTDSCTQGRRQHTLTRSNPR